MSNFFESSDGRNSAPIKLHTAPDVVSAAAKNQQAIVTKCVVFGATVCAVQVVRVHGVLGSHCVYLLDHWQNVVGLAMDSHLLLSGAGHVANLSIREA